MDRDKAIQIAEMLSDAKIEGLKFEMNKVYDYTDDVKSNHGVKLTIGKYYHTYFDENELFNFLIYRNYVKPEDVVLWKLSI